LFQAYTAALVAPTFALGYLRAPPGLEVLNQTKATPILIAAFGLGFYLSVKEVNSRIVSKMTLNERDSTVKIETVSSVGRHDPFVVVPLASLTASPFVPRSLQSVKANGKTLFVDHKGGKIIDLPFFTALGNRQS
jgi:hypothetical protein